MHDNDNGVCPYSLGATFGKHKNLQRVIPPPPSSRENYAANKQNARKTRYQPNPNHKQTCTPQTRVYRFTRHCNQTDSNDDNKKNNNNNTAAAAGSDNRSHKNTKGKNRPASAGQKVPIPPELQTSASETGAANNNLILRATTTCGGGLRGGSDGLINDYPNDLQSWKPPMLFQFCKVCTLPIEKTPTRRKGLPTVGKTPITPRSPPVRTEILTTI